MNIGYSEQSLASYALVCTSQSVKYVLPANTSFSMDCNHHSFFEKAFHIVKEESAEVEPLIRFKHPKELEKILDLEVSQGCTDEVLEECVRQVLAYSVKTNSPKFKNQLYAGPDPYGLAGTWIAEAFNTSQYTYEVAPAFTLIEMKMLRHVLQLFGIPEGDGIFSPGGSLSMMYAVVAARYKAFPEVKTKGTKALPDLIIFTSEDSHYSIKKAAHWLGFGTENVRVVQVNENGQMIIEKLEEAIQEQMRQSRVPLMVNATAGTTVLGAIDNLEAIADISKKYNIWMHVDACWGGSLMLSPKYRNRLRGIEKADSIAWNPHKMVGAPLQCSLFLVRTRGLLHEANSAAAQYLFQQDKFYDTSYDTGDKSVQCGRKIDAFKLWVLWKARGDAGLRHLTNRTMEIAEFCLQSVVARPGFRLVSAPMQCPNICFWYIPSFLREVHEDEHWWKLMHKVTPKIKELLTLRSKLLISYSPLRQHSNFFRLAFTFHPPLEERGVIKIIDAIGECGEEITMGMLY